MQAGTRVAIIGAVATVLAAAIGAGGAIFVEQDKIADCRRQEQIEKTQKEKAYQQLDRYRQRYESAPKAYVRDLERLIDSAPTKMRIAAEGEGADPGAVVVSARSIVASRDGLRSSLEAIGSRLDSQIDELRDELKKPHPDPAKLLQTLQVLRAKWPSKKDEIDVAIRTVITQLGLVPEMNESIGTAPGGSVGTRPGDVAGKGSSSDTSAAPNNSTDDGASF